MTDMGKTGHTWLHSEPHLTGTVVVLSQRSSVSLLNNVLGEEGQTAPPLPGGMRHAPCSASCAFRARRRSASSPRPLIALHAHSPNSFRWKQSALDQGLANIACPLHPPPTRVLKAYTNTLTYTPPHAPTPWVLTLWLFSFQNIPGL